MFTVKVPDDALDTITGLARDANDRLTVITDEATERINGLTVRLGNKADDIAEDIKNAGIQMSALTAMGIIAFGLISIVAVSALVIASKKS